MILKPDNLGSLLQELRSLMPSTERDMVLMDVLDSLREAVSKPQTPETSTSKVNELENLIRDALQKLYKYQENDIRAKALLLKKLEALTITLSNEQVVQELQNINETLSKKGEWNFTIERDGFGRISRVKASKSFGDGSNSI